MPRMDGIELLRQLRRKPRRPYVIAVSGGGMTMDADFPLDMAHRMGADLTLEKPFDFEHLTAVIETALQRTPTANAA
jgi:DNA-binding response OmpR family regulator